MTSVRKLFSAVLVLLLTGLGAGAAHAGEFVIGVRAINGADAAFRQWGATIEHLNKSIPGHKFILKPVIDLKLMNRMAARGEFDFVLTNPSSYVEMNTRYGMKAIATLNNKRANTSQMRFGTVIFTHVLNEDILTLKDLKGKTLMAVSETAFGGWRVAWLEMLESGIDPYRDLRKVVYSPRSIQKEVVFAVLDRRVDAGVVRTDMLERMASSRKIDLRYLRILNSKDVEGFPFFLSTRLYPEWPFAAAKKVPADIAGQVRTALLGIGSDSTAARQGKYIGWHEALSYQSVENLMKRLGVGPWKGKEPARTVSGQSYIAVTGVMVMLVLAVGFFVIHRSRTRKS